MIVFVDTFAMIAWLNPRDAHHTVVAAYLDSFTGRLLTTDWVLTELADALCAPEAPSRAAEFLKAVRADPMFVVVPYDQDIYDAGFELYANRPDKAWSLTDCVSFAVMTDRNVTEALTADHHFE